MEFDKSVWLDKSRFHSSFVSDPLQLFAQDRSVRPHGRQRFLHPVRPEKLEIHRNYVDIQLLLAGRETIVYRPVDGLPVTAEYDAVRDIAFYHLDENGSVALPLEPGNFALFFPEEGHLPGNGNPADSVVKVVVKIERSLLEG